MLFLKLNTFLPQKQSNQDVWLERRSGLKEHYHPALRAVNIIQGKDIPQKAHSSAFVLQVLSKPGTRGINSYALWSWEVAGAILWGQPVWWTIGSTVDITGIQQSLQCRLQAQQPPSSISYLRTRKDFKRKQKEERFQNGIKGGVCLGAVLGGAGRTKSTFCGEHIFPSFADPSGKS